jgi:hypothetical protein
MRGAATHCQRHTCNGVWWRWCLAAMVSGACSDCSAPRCNPAHCCHSRQLPPTTSTAHCYHRRPSPPAAATTTAAHHRPLLPTTNFNFQLLPCPPLPCPALPFSLPPGQRGGHPPALHRDLPAPPARHGGPARPPLHCSGALALRPRRQVCGMRYSSMQWCATRHFQQHTACSDQTTPGALMRSRRVGAAVFEPGGGTWCLYELQLRAALPRVNNSDWLTG